MILEAVGVDGSKQYGCHLCSMMLGEHVLLDAGSASMLSGGRQEEVKTVLLTHAHLDHVLELGFMLDATVAARGEPLVVAGSAACLDMVGKHYMNDLVWPDFGRIRISGSPSLVYMELRDREWTRLPGGVEAWSEPVCHGAGARGFIFRSETGSIVYTGDTGPTYSLWEKASELDDLRAVIAEISFPNSMTDTAIASDHLTPVLLRSELRKLGSPEVPVYAFHLKPWNRREIKEEVAAGFGDAVTVLRRGDRVEF